jgi:hypothetical protein
MLGTSMSPAGAIISHADDLIVQLASNISRGQPVTGPQVLPDPVHAAGTGSAGSGTAGGDDDGYTTSVVITRDLCDDDDSLVCPCAFACGQALFRMNLEPGLTNG